MITFPAMGNSDSTILYIKVFDERTRQPLDAMVTFYRNNDFTILHQSGTDGGEHNSYLSSPGWYLIEVSLPNYHQKIDTLWVTNNKKRIIKKDFFLASIEPGFTITLNRINFYFNSTMLKQTSYATLDSVVDFLKSHNALRIEVAGHTDDEGPDTYNLDLSKGRARSILDYIIANGIEKERLTAIGYGESRPLDPGITKAAKARNRRVELVVIGLSSRSQGNDVTEGP